MRARSCPSLKSEEIEFMTPLMADLPSGNGIMDTSPRGSADSISMCVTTSTRDSLETLESEYIDVEDTLSIKSIGRTTINIFLISEEAKASGSTCKNDVLLDMEMVDKNKLKDLQICATISSNIYEHLHSSEVRKRTSTDFMERVQKDINASMHAILIYWLVEEIL